MMYGKSIREFGACGDGVSDDTAALKQALGYPGAVYFPEGIYVVREQLSAESISVRWRGAGDCTVIRLIPADTSRTVRSFRGMDVFSTRLLFLKGCKHIELRDMVLDANKEAFDKDICGNGSCRYDYTTCLDIWEAESILLENMTFRGGLIEGVYINRSSDIRIHRCKFVDNGFEQDDAAGLQIEGPVPDTPAIFISDCEFSRNGFNGLELTGVSGAVISNVVCNCNGFDGIAFWKGCTHCTVNGAFAEGNHRDGVTFRRNFSVGNADVMQEGCERFCSDIIINGLVTRSNRFGIRWGCAENITLNGWNGTDTYNHALCYLYPGRDITAVITGANLSPREGDIFNPILTPADEELFEEYGAVPLGDPERFKPRYLP